MVLHGDRSMNEIIDILTENIMEEHGFSKPIARKIVLYGLTSNILPPELFGHVDWLMDDIELN